MEYNCVCSLLVLGSRSQSGNFVFCVIIFNDPPPVIEGCLTFGAATTRVNKLKSWEKEKR